MTTIMKRNNGNNVPAANFGGLVDKLFQDNLSRFFDDSFWGFDGYTGRNSVPVNIRQTDKAYELHFVAPGLKKENFKVDINGDSLTVSFEQRNENNREDKENGWLRQEYNLQSFTRTFNIDDTVDANKIEAKYIDGVLQLTLPKKEGAIKTVKTIEIK